MSSGMDYKAVKEKFVSGHEGTSVLEIAAVVTVAPLSVLLRNAVVSWIYNDNKPSRFSKLLLDFLLLIVPALSAFTILCDHLDAVYSTVGFCILGVLVFGGQAPSKAVGSGDMNFPTLNTLWSFKTTEKQPFISWFRSSVNIATAISILAVDFPVYPRRFAKAETFGTGFMDAGVGSFVISNAIVSPEARGKYLHAGSLSAKLKNILKSITSTLPLWILGFARMATVKAANYQEHVSEYGVHWNFFFTLAAIKVGSTICLCVADPKWSGCTSVIIAILYQYLLTGQGLEQFVLHGSDSKGTRDGFLNANREGVCSCLGYLAIYFAGVELGRFLFRKRSTYSEWFWAFWHLILLDLLCWTLLYFSEVYIEPVSRRMANLPFMLWMLAYNLQLISFFLLADLVFIPLTHFRVLKKVSSISQFCLMESINNNGLFYFLLANVLTGCVNLSMSTVTTGDITALVVLISYMFLLSLTVAVLSWTNITLKFW